MARVDLITFDSPCIEILNNPVQEVRQREYNVQQQYLFLLIAKSIFKKGESQVRVNYVRTAHIVSKVGFFSYTYLLI